MIKRAHMVGNGPSGVEFKKIDPSDFVMGCNIPNIKVDLTTLSDSRILRKIQEGSIKFDFPTLIPEKLDSPIKTTFKDLNINVVGIYERPGNLKEGVLSSGHYATYWLVKQGYTEIHLWGIDSKFKNHMFSHTDKIVDSATKRNPARMKKVTERWNKEWDHIVEIYPEVNFVFHPPTRDYSEVERMPDNNNSSRSQSKKKLIYLFNDTSNYHNGCKKVIESFDGIDKKIKTSESRDVLTEINYSRVSKVILNGEGTMHNNQWTAKRFLMGLRQAQQAGCETEIHNTVWQNMSHEFDDVLQKCTVITTREILSQTELKKHGVDAKIIPDRSLIADVPYEEYEYVNIYEGQYIHGNPKFNRGYTSVYPRIDIFNQEWNEIVNRLRHADLLITQRHHEMYAAIKAHCRFIVIDGNTWKNRGLIETVGANLPTTVEDALSGSYDEEYKKVFDYCDNIKNML